MEIERLDSLIRLIVNQKLPHVYSASRERWNTDHHVNNPEYTKECSARLGREHAATQEFIWPLLLIAQEGNALGLEGGDQVRFSRLHLWLQSVKRSVDDLLLPPGKRECKLSFLESFDGAKTYWDCKFEEFAVFVSFNEPGHMRFLSPDMVKTIEQTATIEQSGRPTANVKEVVCFEDQGCDPAFFRADPYSRTLWAFRVGHAWTLVPEQYRGMTLLDTRGNEVHVPQRVLPAEEISQAGPQRKNTADRIR